MVLVSKNPEGHTWSEKYGAVFYHNVLAIGQVMMAAKSTDFTENTILPTRVPLTVQVNFSSSWDGGPIHLIGEDPRGVAQLETITTVTGSDTIQSLKAWSRVTQCDNIGGSRSAGSVALETGEHIALQHLGVELTKLKMGNGSAAAGTFSVDPLTGIITTAKARNTTYASPASGNDFAFWWKPV